MLTAASSVNEIIIRRRNYFASTVLKYRSSVQLGRSLIALAQILILTSSDWEKLTPTIYNEPESPTCRAAGQLSLFCTLSGIDNSIIKWFIVAALVLVISGFAPLLTSVLHGWIAFSISTGIGLPDGGEQVAQVLCFLIPLIFLVQPLANGWSNQRPEAPREILLSISAVGLRILMIQFAFIYIESGISKLAVADWQNGSALYYVLRDPSFGPSGWLGDLLTYLSNFPLVTAILTWGTICVEVAIGILILLGKLRARRIAFLMIVLLHLGIIVSIGLWSFGTIMIAGGVLACLPIALPYRLTAFGNAPPRNEAETLTEERDRLNI